MFFVNFDMFGFVTSFILNRKTGPITQRQMCTDRCTSQMYTHGGRAKEPAKCII